MRTIEKQILLTFALLGTALFLILINPALAADEFKPWLHKASVPEHPKVKLYGSYQTALFPGAATYSYTIEVPQGTSSLQPSISISYNSQTVKQRPGILGAGWSLTQNYVYRDVNSTPDNTTDDKFVLILNGNSHELIYDSADSLYHTKIESFTKVQNLTGAPNTNGLYWLVTAKDGIQYRFGYNPDSELASNTGRIYSLRWSLDQIQDTHDNKVFYSYSEDPYPKDNGTQYISQILYNNDKRRKIDFVYESSDRPDVRFVYDQGNELNETRRLSEIRIFADNNLVRKYQIEYANLNPENSSSAISKIKYMGSDNSSVLHQISFGYYPTVLGYTKHEGGTSEWVPPVSFSTLNTDYGVRLVDLNNDGFVDIIQGRASEGLNRTWINNGVNNWTQVTDKWKLPAYIVDPLHKDLGVRFTDFNKDGFVDVLQATDSGNLKKAWESNGTGWVDVTAVWEPPDYFVVGGNGKDNGMQIVDFNGDGRDDILQYRIENGNPIRSAYMNNGHGWTDVSSTWKSPVEFIIDNSDSGARILDVNSDGLPDILQGLRTGDTVTRKAWLNNGTGWVESSNWVPPAVFTWTTNRPDNGTRFTDANGDGLVDIIIAYTDDPQKTLRKDAHINNGNGWTSNADWGSPDQFTENGDNIGRRLADFNGDGFADIVVAYTAGSDTLKTWTKNSTTAFLLHNITTEFGGTISVTYANSTGFNNTGNDTLSDLGFNIFVVKNVTYNNSMSNAFSSVFNYSYNYSGGRYDNKDSEFRGFSKVNETLPDNSLIIHYFHQGATLKGREYRTEVYNSSGNVFSKDETLFNYTNISAGYFKVFTVAQANYLHDGIVANPKITNVTYSYDSFGNVISRNFLGDVNVTGDEKYENYSYAINTTNWLVDKLSWYLLFDSNYQKVREMKYHYDGRVYGKNATKGDVTAVENWNNLGANPITRFEYDKFGNVIKTTDPLGRETNYRYGLRDTTFTFVDKITNALDHQTDFKYDLGTGNLLWKKQNGIYTFFYYDVFGRLVKEVQPFDSFELPTKSYSYSFDGTAPESIKISQRTTSNKTFDTYFYYDGLGNFIQFKKPGDGNQHIVKNLFYDGIGRVTSESNPYFATFGTGLTTTQNSDFTNYTYDALSGVITVRNPDGNSSRIIFNHWNITAYDENTHRKMYATDAYGRIVNVLEYNNDPVLKFNFETDTYTTSYNYDASDNIIKITDTLGNQFVWTYDSLGRKIAFKHPDSGNWSYTYDLAGNLVRQVQNGGGNLVTGDGYYREYNELNQLTIIRNGSIASSPQLENYTYDPFGQRMKIMRNDSANTTIYTPFKEFMRVVNSSGTYDFTYIYDGNTLVARVNPDGSKWYYHPDHLGSTTLITDQNGNAVENTFYSPYGELLGGGTADFKLYTGQFKDQTDFYMLGEIPYNPEWALRLKPDPMIPNPFNPQYLNSYSYALNNPYKYRDTTGNYVESVVDIAFITMDIQDIIADPTNLWNYASLVADMGGLIVPGVTGGRVVIKGAEAGVKTFSSAEKVTDVNKITKNTPNPWGSKGSPEHQSKVAEKSKDMESRDLKTKTEFTITDPETGKTRRADVVGINKEGKVQEVYQVGRETKSGDPVSRERSALSDIKTVTKKLGNFAENVKIEFVKYIPKIRKLR